MGQNGMFTIELKRVRWGWFFETKKEVIIHLTSEIQETYLYSIFLFYFGSK